MTEVLFYHLERARLEQILPELLEKSLQRGWRALVRAGNGDAAEAINNLLWTYTDESFLPHGMDRGADSEPDGGTDSNGADHPVLVTTGEGGGSERHILFLVEGGEAGNEEIGKLIRCIRIFDGGDGQAVDKARAFWKQVKEAGHDATYWRQSPEGRWEKQG